jgi:hypothetical protein
MIHASCGANHFEREIDKLARGKSSLKEFPAREKIEWERAVHRSADKEVEIMTCRAKKMDRSRDANPPAVVRPRAAPA